MYIIRDFVGPAVWEAIGYHSLKNQILKEWDTTVLSDGTKVFDRLYMYSRNKFTSYPLSDMLGGTCTDYSVNTQVLYNTSRQKLYKILGIKKEDLTSDRCLCAQDAYTSLTDEELAVKSSYETYANAVVAYDKIVAEYAAAGEGEDNPTTPPTFRNYILYNIKEHCPDKGKGVDYHDVVHTWLYFNKSKEVEGRKVLPEEVNIILTANEVCKYITDNTPLIHYNPNVDIAHIDTEPVAAVYDINGVLVQEAYDRPVPITPTVDYDSDGWYTNYAVYTKDVESSFDNSETFSTYDPDIGEVHGYRDLTYVTNAEILSDLNGQSFRIHYNELTTTITITVIVGGVPIPIPTITRTSHQCLFLVLTDTMQQVFERKVRVVNRVVKRIETGSIDDPKLTKYTSSPDGYGPSTSFHYTLEASIEIKFRRRVDPYTVQNTNENYTVTSIIGLPYTTSRPGLIARAITFAATLNSYTGEYFSASYDVDGSTPIVNGYVLVMGGNTKSISSPVVKQYINMNNALHPFTGSSLWTTVDNAFGQNPPRLKYDVIKNMPAKQFCEEILPLIDSDGEMVDRNPGMLETFVSFTILAAVVIAAVIIAMPSGGASMSVIPATATAVGLSAAAAAELAIIGAIAFNLTIAVVVLTSIALVYKNSGGIYQAAILLRSAQFVGFAATAMGAFSMISGGINSIVNSIASPKAILDQVIDGAIVYAKAAVASTSNMLMSGLRFLTIGFKIYSTYIEPPDKGNAALQRTLDEQNAEMAKDTSSADNIDQNNWIFDSKHENIYDTNEFMQFEIDKMCYNSTQGKLQQYYRDIL